MFMKNNLIKVKFQDQQLDDYVLENAVLKSKLQSKIEALSILSNELDKCSMERDRYIILVQQLKRKQPYIFSDDNTKHIQSKPLSGGELLAKTREQNNVLKLEVEVLRTRLDESIEDIKALRKQLQISEDNTISLHTIDVYSHSNFEYEKLVKQLEKIKKKYQQIQLEYRATLDDKEELIADRDHYKNKVVRLNHQINSILCNQAKSQGSDEKENDVTKSVVDIDALVMENKYLHERLTQFQAEKEILKQTLTKYKKLLENRNKSNSLNFTNGIIDVMTQKQVRNFLNRNNSGSKKVTVAELKSLCMGLFEALNDKSIALQHQKKTNQILANRITELEKTLESWSNGEKYIPIFPSQMLLEEFCPDEELTKLNKSDEITNEEFQGDPVDFVDNENIDSDEEKNHSESSCDNSKDSHIVSCNSESSSWKSSKVILPPELEELVQNALAELKPPG